MTFSEWVRCGNEKKRVFFFVIIVKVNPESTNLINNQLKMVARSGFWILYFFLFDF